MIGPEWVPRHRGHRSLRPLLQGYRVLGLGCVVFATQFGTYSPEPYIVCPEPVKTKWTPVWKNTAVGLFSTISSICRKYCRMPTFRCRFGLERTCQSIGVRVCLIPPGRLEGAQDWLRLSRCRTFIGLCILPVCLYIPMHSCLLGFRVQGYVSALTIVTHQWAYLLTYSSHTGPILTFKSRIVAEGSRTCLQLQVRNEESGLLYLDPKKPTFLGFLNMVSLSKSLNMQVLRR